MPKTPLVRHPLLAGCSAEVTHTICPRSDECRSPDCGHDHWCSSPASCRSCACNRPGNCRKLARRGECPSTKERIRTCHLPIPERLKSAEAIANRAARQKQNLVANSATEKRKVQKSLHKAARNGTNRENLTEAQFDAHGPVGLRAIEHLPAFRRLLEIPEDGLGAVDFEGVQGRKGSIEEGFYPMSAGVVGPGCEPLLTTAVNSAALFGETGIDHVGKLYPGSTLDRHIRMARWMASKIAGGDDTTLLSNEDIDKFFESAPTYEDFVSAYGDAGEPLKALICYHGPESKFHSSVGSGTEMVDVFPIVVKFMQPACRGNRTVPLGLSSIWRMFYPDQAFPGKPHDATADAIAVCNCTQARRIAQGPRDRVG